MPHDIALILALALPTLIIVALRLNGAMMFLSLCLGAILVQYVGSNTNDLMDLISPRAGTLSKSTLSLGLLLIPAIVTGMVTLMSVHGRLRVLFNILPALAMSSLAVLLVVPLLSPHMAATLERGGTWHFISHAESLIVSSGALVSLLALWTQRHHFKGHESHKRKH
jgi:ABC-type polysaccharide/polyol phosphate export permease